MLAGYSTGGGARTSKPLETGVAEAEEDRKKIVMCGWGWDRDDLVSSVQKSPVEQAAPFHRKEP